MNSAIGQGTRTIRFHAHGRSAERYEHKSVMLTTNLVFSEWQRIFKNPMTTLDVS